MGFRFDSPLAIVVGVCFAVVALTATFLDQSSAIQFGSGTSPLHLALGAGAFVVIAALWIATDDAFDG